MHGYRGLESAVDPKAVHLGRLPHCEGHSADQENGVEEAVRDGPLGVFEKPAFAEGTLGIARAVAGCGAFSVIGGGDTIAAVRQAGVADRIGYMSTAGGAFLEFLEGKTLPAVAVLEQRAAA